MARLASVAVGGYYPTPAHLIPAIAAQIDATAARQARYDPRLRASVYPTYGLLDPCAGDGAALLACAQALFGAPLPAGGQGPRLRLYTCELEATRATALRARCHAAGLRAGDVTALAADAFQLTWTTDETAAGVDLLWLNPPYDRDPAHGRLEQAFLARFTPVLTPGSGILVFIVPGYALAASAATLAAEYEACAAFRFPPPEYAAFKQVALVAHRRRYPLTLAGAAAGTATQIRAWAADPMQLPVLPVPGAPVLALAAEPGGGLRDLVAHPLDLQALLVAVRPWTAGAAPAGADPAPAEGDLRPARAAAGLTPLAEVGVHQAYTAFLRRVLPVAMPPKPAYLALLLPLLNGQRVAPDDPAGGWPPILVKGRFRKDFRTVKEHADKQGRVQSLIQVQQPVLTVTILTLTAPPRYVALAPGTTPSGATAVDGMNVADLLVHYGRGLSALVAAQFPALHDPTAATGLLPLPALARPLYTAQAHVVQTALKLLGQGRLPFILGEVGSGKSMISLAVAAALTPAHFAATRGALRAGGLWSRARPLRPITRLLVLAPPHLRASWSDQVRLALPGADIVIVERIADLHAPLPSPTDRAHAWSRARRDGSLGAGPALGPRMLGDGAGPGAGLTVYVLSRETAKLGPGVRPGLVAPGPAGGPLPRCPRCGAPVADPPARIVERHTRCAATPLVAAHPRGALARALAPLLIAAYPDDDLVRALVPAHMLQRAALWQYERLMGAPASAPPDAPEAALAEPGDSGHDERNGAADRAQPAATAPVCEAAWRERALAMGPGGAPALGRLTRELTAEIGRLYAAAEAAEPVRELLVTIAGLLPLAPRDRPLTRLFARGLAWYTTREPDATLRALLAPLLLLHLSAGPAAPPLVARTVRALWPLSLSQPGPYTTGASLRDTLARLLLLLLSVDPGELDALEAELRALPLATPRPYDGGTVWTAFDRARARLTAELADAAAVAANPAALHAAQERAATRRRAATSPGEWLDLAVDLAGGALTCAVDGVTHAVGSAAPARAALDTLVHLGGFTAGRPCGEPLYQAAPAPRRYPLALYIARRRRAFFHAVWLDEVHEFNNVGSAQERAAHLLAHLPGVPVLALTGSLMGGYSSSLFANFRALCPAFRAAFGPHDKGRFVQRFGYLKILKTLPAHEARATVQAYGRQSLRTELDADPLIKTLGEAPGVLPLFLPLFLLPNAAVIHKADLDAELPPLQEQPVALLPRPDDPAGARLLAVYAAVRDALLAAVTADRYTPRAGKLLGALAELPGLLDLASDDVGNALDARGAPVYEIRYAAGDAAGALVARAALLPATTILPKERWMLEQVGAQLARGRNVLLFVRHTGGGRLVTRYQRLLRAACAIGSAYLDSGRVDTAGREAWLREQVIGRRYRVLLVNPEAVKTGLNCLTPYFQTAIWMELTYNALTYRQANGRIHRIGADPGAPVEVYAPVYAGTVQEVALDLLARKVSVSTQMDGLDIESGLEAAGAGGADAPGLTQAAVLGIGAALYDILVGAATAEPQRVPVPAPIAPRSSLPSEPAATAPLGTTETAPPPADAGRYQQAALFDLSEDAA